MATTRKTTAPAGRLLTSTESGFDLPTQTVRMIRTYCLDDVAGTVVRTTFEHDGSHAPQSHFSADVFTPNGWTVVVYILGEDERAKSLPSTHLPRDKRHLVRHGAEAMTAQLLQDARKVLGV